MLATQSPIRPDRVFRFGPFELTPHLSELRRNDRRVHLQNQPMLILVALLDHPGQLVTREALHRLLWPEDTFVDFDTGLNTAIRKLRQALSDSTERPRYIETHSRRGYRFIAPVTWMEFQSGDPALAAGRPTAQRAEIAPSLVEPVSPLKAEQQEIGTVYATLLQREVEQSPLTVEVAVTPLAPADPKPPTAPGSPLSKARRFRRLPLLAARATGALLLVALLLAALLLVGLLTLLHS